MPAYSVTDTQEQTQIVDASYPLKAAQAVREENDTILIVKNLKTGTTCLVDFDLVKTWKEVSI